MQKAPDFVWGFFINGKECVDWLKILLGCHVSKLTIGK